MRSALKQVGSPVDMDMQLRWVRDLQWFDGALLSVFEAPSGKKFLLHWVDCDDQTNRWIAVEIDPRAEVELLNGKRPLRDVLTGQAFLFLVDVVNGAFKQWYFALPALVPADYLPAGGEILDADLVPVSTSDRTKMPVLISGDISLEDHRNLPRLFAESYGFFWAFGSSNQSVPARPFRGGTSVVHHYRNLRLELAASNEFTIDRMQYASPGLLEFSANKDMANRLVKCLDQLKKHYASISDNVRELRGYLRIHEINATPENITNKQEIYLRKRAECVQTLLGGPAFEDVMGTDYNVYQTTKVVMFNYKRLHDIHKYRESGKIEVFPTW